MGQVHLLGMIIFFRKGVSPGCSVP